MKAPRRRSAIIAFIVCLQLPLFTDSARAASSWSDAPAADRHPKLDAALVRVDRAAHERGEDAALEEAERSGLEVRDRRIHVIIQTPRGTRAGGRAAAAAAHGRVTGEYEDLVAADLPPAQLRKSADRSDVRYIRPPALWRETEVAGQGPGATNATNFQGQGFLGAGQKIAIIDGGFAGYTARQGSGDLPNTPALLTPVASFCSSFTDTDHGTAVAEIVHEMAPQAHLYLICFDDEVSLGQAMEYAHAQGVFIINHSVAWYGTSRGDGSGAAGTPDAIVAKARLTYGMTWVNAAGNDAGAHWTGTFRDTNNDAAHNFSGSDQTNNVPLRAGQLACFVLKWDLWPATAQGFGLFLYGPGVVPTPQTPFLAAAGHTPGTPPVTGLCYTPSSSGSYGLLIGRTGSSGFPRMDLYTLGVPPQFVVAAGSLVEPASSPHAFAAGAFCWPTGVAEGYSSRGPTIDGRRKPDISGPDSVSSATYGLFAACGATGFAGTSASAPHVAGAAALVKNANPGYSAGQVQSYLELRATDVGAAGKDNDYGSGRLWFRTFTDVPVWDYGYGAIETLATNAITNGCTYTVSTTARRFCPSNSITRAEMAPFLLRSAGIPPCTSCTVQTFADVPRSNPFYPWIEALVANGITSGCSTSPRRYCPGSPVTRGQMAPFLMRAAGIGPCTTCTTATFADVPRSHPFFAWIERLVSEGVTSGCDTSPKRYCPDSNVTRRDMAIFLVKTFDLTGPPPPPPPPSGGDLVPITGALGDVAFSPDGLYVFATNMTMNRVEVYNVTTETLEAPITVGSQPFGLDVTPDGSRLYVANFGGTNISVVDVATRTQLRTVSVPDTVHDDRPVSVAVTNNNKAIVTTGCGGSGFCGTVLRVDLTTTPETITDALIAVTDHTYLNESADRSAAGLVMANVSSGAVRRYTAGTDTFSANHNLNAFVAYIAVNGNGTQFLVNSFSTTYVLDASLNLSGSISGGGEGLAFAPTGTTGYRIDGDHIDVLNTATFLDVGDIFMPDTIDDATDFNGIGRMTINGAGTTLAAATDNGLSLIPIP